VPWLEQVVPLRGKTVLEYGVGNGAAAAAFAPHSGRYIGIDIDAEAVEAGRRILEEGGVAPQLLAAPPKQILSEVASFRGEVDVFLCYAVLEHMSVDERLALLDLAREVVRPDGFIVVIETPNRLTPWDYHTSQLPFLNQLPEELALRYAHRSQRGAFVEALREASAVGSEETRDTFVRWGRGASFHEFELAFGDLTRHLVSSSWDPVLFAERDVHREELALQRFLDRARPDLPAAFSRYWLDLILTPRPRAEPGLSLRPWSLRTTDSRCAVYDLSEVVILFDDDSVLAVDLPVPSARLIVGVDTPDEDRAITVSQTATGEDFRLPLTRPRDYGVFAEARFDSPADRYTVRLDRPGRVSFVLYEG
jgi:SAM-dependent methyltransferase